MTFPTDFHFGINIDSSSHALLEQDGQANSLLKRLDDGFALITLEDGFALSTGDGLDAILLANWLGARTSHAGILAGAPINVLEPFHVSTAIATLDYVTEGRAGLLAQPLEGERAAAAKRAIGELNGYPENDRKVLERDLGEAIDVIRRLWDSWEDDAVIRDPESQRFIDGAKLRYVDFKGANFNVLGPSITPRPPQGQPVVATRLGPEQSTSLTSTIDLAFLPANDRELLPLVKDIKSKHPGLQLFADVRIGADTPVQDMIPQWAADAETAISQARALATAGLDGIRFLPRRPERDLAPLVAHILPALQESGLVRPRHGSTLRERLSLPAATNRYTVAAA